MSSVNSGWSELAAAVIKRARLDNDKRFFDTEWYIDLKDLAQLGVSEAAQPNQLLLKTFGGINECPIQFR